MNTRDYQLQRLTDAQIADPRKVLRSFFTEFTLEDFRQSLKDYIYEAMTSQKDREDNYRAHVLYMAEMMESIVECSYLLQKEKKSRK